jgi:hypothetical protein
MNFLRAAASEVIGLFVGDWTQTIVSIVILAVGWFAIGRMRQTGLGFIVAFALAAQLVVATRLEARRRA